MRHIGRLGLGIAVWWLATLPTLAWDRGCDDSQPGYSESGDSACYRFSDEGSCFAQDTGCLGQTLANGRYQSLFWVGVDSLWLTHSGSEFRSEILDPGNNTVTIAQTLDHGLPVAPRVRMGTLLLDSFRTELSYFGTVGWESSATLRNVAPLPDLDATIDYDAELHNVEWNFFGGQSEVDSHWLIGLRYLRYRDSFSEAYRLDTGFGPLIEETARGEATNDAFGPQAGVGLDLGGGSTRLHLGAKLGLMNNQVQQSGPGFNDAIVIDGIAETTFDNDSNEFAWLGDLEVTLEHQVSRSVSFRLGYQGLFLDNVVQSATQNGQQSKASQISFHGLVLGAQWVR
ncbi:hypothetical protein Enr13x_57560 [Stieleria neptunia]|uniref:Legionella pneumophila major outer membrane protein n=1 Tax=Stieleria neptunia TaxID=2527979 RepID=A0A518HYC4_9BACT|nr:BBP7 family outer membrane beta-barrel protein [Stieleria neptunia]QDV45853.1 hypothetical protein Enr13x_57560 [Stieleria neptunia]